MVQQALWFKREQRALCGIQGPMFKNTRDLQSQYDFQNFQTSTANLRNNYKWQTLGTTMGKISLGVLAQKRAGLNTLNRILWSSFSFSLRHAYKTKHQYHISSFQSQHSSKRDFTNGCTCKSTIQSSYFPHHARPSLTLNFMECKNQNFDKSISNQF